MIQLPDERRPPITPLLAMRVAVLGGAALTMFAIIFFRLWFLEVLSGNDYLAQALNNRERRIVIQAPRGLILDRNGKTIVDNRQAVALQVDPQTVPTRAGPREAMYGRLARLLHEPLGRRRCVVGDPRHPVAVLRVTRLECQVDQRHFVLPFADVTLKTDVARPVLNHYYENMEKFPGVTYEDVFLRRYPLRGTAAQILGIVGEISPAELHQSHFSGVRQGTIVGQSGIEYTYDRYLRGRQGAIRIAVDALGNAKGLLRRQDPVIGKNLRLSLDLDLQQEGQQAIAKAVGAAHGLGNPADAGAFVALDPRNGEVLAMGSSPSYDPNIFAKPVPPSVYRRLNNDSSRHPLVDRAIQSMYPTGSTFKLITATAALQSGAITPNTVVDDPGSVTISGREFKDAGGIGHGALALPTALQVSSDVFFYKLGAEMNTLHPSGGPIQEWARRFGIGRPTGIDLPGEVPGNLPSPAYRTRRNEAELACRRRNHGRPCGISDLRTWTIGDNVNLAVGQGDLLATPLQMAVAYAALANGGTVVRPHVGLQVEDTVGKALQRIEPPANSHFQMAEASRQAILDGLHLATSAPGGTSADVFRGFPKPVYGKTGTAQHLYQADQSWYVAYVPDPVRPIVVAITVEKGGFGAQSAAPAARLMLSQWFHVHKRFQAGASKTL